jgi:hypothetical protein
LGYPLKLVRVPEHTFFRWEDERERFNVQHTKAGSELRSDESYYEWPRKWTREMFDSNARTGVWLGSLTPRQETSKFLCNRAMVLRDAARLDEGMQATQAAARYDPRNPACVDLEFDIQTRLAGNKRRAGNPDREIPR